MWLSIISNDKVVGVRTITAYSMYFMSDWLVWLVIIGANPEPGNKCSRFLPKGICWEFKVVDLSDSPKLLYMVATYKAKSLSLV